MEDMIEPTVVGQGTDLVFDIHERGQAGAMVVSGEIADKVKLVLTTLHEPRTSKVIAAEIERLKIELRGAKAREKTSQSAEGKAQEAREKGAKEECVRAVKLGFGPETGSTIEADVAALVAAGWDREVGTWRKGDRLLFLSKTGWVAGQIGSRDWRPVVSVAEHLTTAEVARP